MPFSAGSTFRGAHFQGVSFCALFPRYFSVHCFSAGSIGALLRSGFFCAVLHSKFFRALLHTKFYALSSAGVVLSAPSPGRLPCHINLGFVPRSIPVGFFPSGAHFPTVGFSPRFAGSPSVISMAMSFSVLSFPMAFSERFLDEVFRLQSFTGVPSV